MLPEHPSFLIRGEDGQEYGPVDLDELRDWVQENRAGLGTEVCRDEPGATWQPWQNHPELVALLAELNGTSPGPSEPGLIMAPMGKRILACVMDLILSSILTSPIFYVFLTLKAPDWQEQFTQMLLQPNNPIPEPLYFYVMTCNAISYLVLTIYLAGFHAAHGRTPGKSMLRLRVVDENGQKPILLKSLLRGLICVMSFYLYGLPLAYAFFNPQRRALHDVMAGTYVVEA